MSKKFVPDEKFDKKLKKLFNSDKSILQIAQNLKISKKLLYQQIHRLNLKRLPRIRYKIINPYEILELRKSGLSYSKIATQLNIHPATLLYKRRNLGIYDWENYDALRFQKSQAVKKLNAQFKIKPTPRNFTNCLAKNRLEIEKLLSAGVSKIKIARKFNVSLATLWSFLYINHLNSPAVHKLDGKDKIITDLFKSGVTLEKIAKKLNCHVDTLHIKIKQLGIKRKSICAKSPLDKYDIKIKSLYEDGFDYIKLAKIFEVHPETMKKHIHKLNLVEGPRMEKYDSAMFGKSKQLIELRQKGLLFKEIAKILGVKEVAVSARYRKLKKDGIIPF